MYDRFGSILTRPLTGLRIRGHGDFHLEQVLMTGDDVVIVDFEGEPDRYLEERRLRFSPLYDVASMLHSFRSAADTAEARAVPGVDGQAEDRATRASLLRAWTRWVSAAYLGAYRESSGGAAFLPEAVEEWAILLDAFLLEKALIELATTLRQAPDEVVPDLQAIIELLGDPPGAAGTS
jgi:maltose alpha-D-glucosyltransferase/alpha-amylase